MLWESCTPETMNEDNMRLFYLADDAKCGDLAATFMHKRISQFSLQWSSDERTAVRMASNGEILFYENNDFSKVVRRLSDIGKVSDFSMGPGRKFNNFVFCSTSILVMFSLSTAWRFYLW